MKWFWNLSIQWKLASVFGVVVALLGVTAWLSMQQLSSVDSDTQTLYEDPLLGSVQYARMGLEIDQLRSAVTAGLGDPANAAQGATALQTHTDKLAQMFKDAYAADIDGVDKPAIKGIEDATIAYEKWATGCPEQAGCFGFRGSDRRAVKD